MQDYEWDEMEEKEKSPTETEQDTRPDETPPIVIKTKARRKFRFPWRGILVIAALAFFVFLRCYESEGCPFWASSSGSDPNYTHSDNADDDIVVDSVSATVWIPQHGGKRYHRNSSCSGMKGPKEVTVDEAKSKGFTPCGRCYG